MSLKVNNLSTRPRIIIDVMPDGSSTMKVQGGLNMVAASVVLCNQLNVLVPRTFQELFKNSVLTDAKGQPIPTNTQGIETVPDEKPELEPLSNGTMPEKVQ